MLTHSKTDIESCDFVFASACLQDMAVCNLFCQCMFTGRHVPGLIRGWESVYVHLQIFKHLLYFVFLQNLMERHHSTIPCPVSSHANTPQDAHKTLSLVQQIEQIISNDVTAHSYIIAHA